MLLSVKNTMKEFVGKNDFAPIYIIQAERQVVKGNIIIER